MKLQIKQVEVLFEEIVEINGQQYLTGYTREYVKVAMRANQENERDVNTIRNCVITDFITDELMEADII